MKRRKEALPLQAIQVIPELPPAERTKRMERLVDTIAKTSQLKGYLGCKYDPDRECGEVYLAR